MPESKLTILKQEDFEKEVLSSQHPVLIDFWASWCQPCRMMMPIIEELAQEYEGRAKIMAMNIDENSEAAQEHGILGVPTLIAFKNGEEQQRISGLHSKQQLKNLLDELIKQE